ncbi:MAG: MG2 domain-containing protein, partial [Victivallales bacterium]|nr:MG2 domain-containing protein [Victivallales bacterium]
ASGGNTSRMLIWLAELAIIERDADGGKLYIVTDALTGKAVDFCRLKFFAYTSEYIRDPEKRKQSGDKYEFNCQELFSQTGADGMVFVAADKFKSRSRVMVEAEVDGRSGILGFGSLYCRRYQPQKMELRDKVFIITDRPLYRPGQTVNFNVWLRESGYGKADYSGKYAGKKFNLTVSAPLRKLFSKTYIADSSGNFNSSFKLPDDADLGQYSISLGIGASQGFRVEEYRKPEFEVKVGMPAKTLLLGDNIPVTVKADYLFGAPVAGAEVEYKVYRTAADQAVQPFFYWEWLYKSGSYSYFESYKYRSWYGTPPVELLAAGRGVTGADGGFTFSIDTGIAKALFADTDSEYKVVAEVTDSSRYTESGQGTVIAACRPFTVFCTANKGFFHTGEVVKLSLSAFTANRKQVTGKYTVDLYKIAYDRKRRPLEHKLKSWSGVKDEAAAQMQFRPDAVGHYLAKAVLTDSAGNSGSFEQVIRVIGKGVSRDENLSRPPLEIISDKLTYQPGDVASLLLDGARTGDVFYFVRPAGTGEVNHAELASAGSIQQLRIRPADMPNIFVEALAVRDGRLHSVVKQILVPPEKKILNIDFQLPAENCKPGQQCPLKIKITDAQGKPVAGNVVLTVYDKALDILSGGSNIPDIYEFFWGWKRYWYSQARTSLDKYCRNLLRRNETRMRRLGIFGGLPAVRYKSFSVAKAEESSDRGNLVLAAPDTGAGDKPVVVRRNFADSAIWKVALKTDVNGLAELPIPLPDNLTTWKIRAWALTDKCSVGQGESEVIVSKDYLVRLILPRFLNSGDTATISAIVMNRGGKSGDAETVVEVSGDNLKLLDVPLRKSRLEAQDEKRFDWQVRALKEGIATVTVKSRCGGQSDALELQLPIQIRGIVKQLAWSGYMKVRKVAAMKIDVPAKRKPETTKLTVNFSPSIAAAMVDALPYLINTDERDLFATVNRFIPALIARNTLKKLNIDLKAVAAMKANLNPAELGAKSGRAAQWKRFENNPVFSDEKLTRLVKRELATLCGMQNSDGGWGWFSGFYERSYVDTTVRAVRALQSAAENGAAFDRNILDGGIAWLQAWQQRRIEDMKKDKLKVNNTDALVFDTLSRGGVKSGFMLEKLFAERAELSLCGLTLSASACLWLRDEAKVKMYMCNIEQFLVEDEENQTAYLRIPDSYCWWRWYGRDIETQAEYLKLLAATAPQDKRAAWLAKYILINRKHADYWNSAVDTGLCVEALCAFLQQSGETAPDMTVTVLYDGKVRKQAQINAATMFNPDNSLELAGDELSSGSHTVEIRREGGGTVYYNAYLSYFSLEDRIEHAGLDLKIRRRYFKLEPAAAKTAVRGSCGQALKADVENYTRKAIKDFSEILSGDLVEIEFSIESKNDYGYIVIRDGKAAGFEPVTKLSGYTPNSLGAYVEMRDCFVRFYIRSLARGRHSLSYRMRAVTPGVFAALPTTAFGAYAPELRGNSDSFTLKIMQ